MEGLWLNDTDYGLQDIGFEVMGRAFREAKAARFSRKGRPVMTVVVFGSLISEDFMRQGRTQ
jgi:tRNA(Arg) A34 adenosine deaminase TadA